MRTGEIKASYVPSLRAISYKVWECKCRYVIVSKHGLDLLSSLI